ncbi:MAG: exopolysaccharide biosynthesis polyprenyl glycosylphosphotransferase [Hyphomicrobium sp.]|nr:exopolysaccharide biosynthesis polyprenyl glycosylphosphotransferase [Hyphomicrobium sp.]
MAGNNVFGSVERTRVPVAAGASRFALSSTAFAAAAFIVELVFIVATAIVTGIAYHSFAYGYPGSIEQYANIGGLAGFVYGLTFLIRDEYSVESLLEGHRVNTRLFLVWSLAFVTLAAIGFLTKSTAEFSRGWLVLFYGAGLVVVVALNAGVQRSLAALIDRGIVRRRKLMIVGTEDDVAKLEREISDGAASVYVAARAIVPGTYCDQASISEVLEKAAANARVLGIEDVVISSGLSRPDFLDSSVAAFSLLPVAIHVGAGGLLSRFKDAEVARFGRATTLSLTREPLGPFEAMTKRAFDVASSSIALVLLSPLFLVIAALIKLDTPGPVFFRQRRRGYNLIEFGIWKFRTMTVQDDGDVVVQATRNDARVTRLGRFLRKSSLDELPQLFNVLRGEMSLVGPRPHAVAHDRFFEKRIALYPRRLNMKPGITGWAQVNGFRGATETDEAMSNRVDHDLYYIDNWSVAFDIYIVMLTVLSRKAQQNAH